MAASWADLPQLLLPQFAQSLSGRICSVEDFLQTVAVTLPERDVENFDKLSKITKSRLVKKAIDSQGFYSYLFAKLRDYRPGESISLPAGNGSEIYIKGSVATGEKGELVVKISSVKLPKVPYGRSSSKTSLAFYKTVGTILNGIAENAIRAPGKFPSVKVIGVTVVNQRLEKTLIEFGFIPVPGVLNYMKGWRGTSKGVSKVVASIWKRKAGVGIPNAEVLESKNLAGYVKVTNWPLSRLILKN